MEKKNSEHVHWMDQASQDHNLNEEIKKNPGFGKPFPKTFFKGDTYSNFLKTAKEAGYLPSWVQLQKEIKTEIASALKLKNNNENETKLVNAINLINEKIIRYNRECPPNLQKGRVSEENLERQLGIWN